VTSGVPERNQLHSGLSGQEPELAEEVAPPHERKCTGWTVSSAVIEHMRSSPGRALRDSPTAPLPTFPGRATRSIALDPHAVDPPLPPCGRRIGPPDIEFTDASIPCAVMERTVTEFCRRPQPLTQRRTLRVHVPCTSREIPASFP